MQCYMISKFIVRCLVNVLQITVVNNVEEVSVNHHIT